MEIEDLTQQQPEVLVVPEGIQLNYEFMGCDLLVLLPTGDPSIAQLVKPGSDPDPWVDVQFWARASMRAYRAWGPHVGMAARLREHIDAHRTLIELLALATGEQS